MSFFAWKKSFSVGIVEIDEQHKKLLEYLNELYSRSKFGKETEINPMMVDRLVSYANTHFKYEEALMKKKGFPELENHKRYHASFETQLREFEKMIHNDSKLAMKTVFIFLRDWFLEHIMEEDKKYVPYVHKKR